MCFTYIGILSNRHLTDVELIEFPVRSRKNATIRVSVHTVDHQGTTARAANQVQSLHTQPYQAQLVVEDRAGEKLGLQPNEERYVKLADIFIRCQIVMLRIVDKDLKMDSCTVSKRSTLV